ncbi:hypothetical protein Tco_0977226 [Tanacetum coccineum]|uniref:Uncharacterized protein n=1 Tax=Tanacetum coccineum TaxID=301880 RepID=A0ABQ5EJJ6_9ASTR
MNKKWHVCFKEVKGFKGYWKTSGKVKDVYVRKDGKVSNVVEEQKKASDDGVILNEKMVSETVQETNVNLIVCQKYRKTSGKVKVVYVRKDAKVSNVVEEQKKALDDDVILNEKMISETVQETDVNLIVCQKPNNSLQRLSDVIIMNVEGLKMVKGNLDKAGYEVKD